MAESLEGLSAQSAQHPEPPIAPRKAAAALSCRKAPTAESPEDIAAQLKFVEELAPYYQLADFREEADNFFKCLFDLWFIRWHLKLQDYGVNRKALDEGTRQKEEWIKEKLCSAASLAPEGDLERSWYLHMTICERQQGVEAKKRKYRDYDGHEGARCPPPRPRPKKVRTSSDNGVGAVPSSDDHIDMVPSSDDCIDMIPSSDDRIDAMPSSDDLIAMIPSSDDLIDTVPSSDNHLDTIPSSDDYINRILK